MPDDDSLKTLLERQCSLQEQQLAKLSALLERSIAAHERVEKLQGMWQQWRETDLETQKKARAYATGQAIGAWLRTTLTVIMLGVIAVAIIVAHYLK